MKKTCLFAVILLIGLHSCKKTHTPTTDIRVLESVTNSPVSGAYLSLFRCNYGCPFGPKVFFRGVTDNNGTCQVPSENYNDAASELSIGKTKYWPFEVQKSTIVFLTPEGFLQLRIRKVGNYPVGSKLLLDLYNQSGSRSDLTDYSTAVDSLIMLRAYGSQQNKIDWQVVDVNFKLVNYGTLNGLQIPKFDTLKNTVLNY